MKSNHDPAPPSPQISPTGDIRKLKAQTAATMEEIRAFLTTMRGKSPKEMLGVIASSTLMKSITQAAIATGAVLLAFTLGPFIWNSIFPKVKSTPVPPPPLATQPAPTHAKATEPEKPKEPAASPKTIDTLGIGEQKSAPSNVNPLEKSSDDILKELKQ